MVKQMVHAKVKELKDTTEYFMKHIDLKDKLNGKYGHDIKYMLNYLNYRPYLLPELKCPL